MENETTYDEATYAKKETWRKALVSDEPLTVTDWLVDAVVAAGAFGFGCLQLTLAVNLLIPDEAMRRLLGIDAMVPTAWAIMAVALTTAPLVMRRRLPWPTFVVVMAVWAFFQYQMCSVSLSLVGPLVALFTVANMRPRAEAMASGGVAILLALFVPSATTSHTLASLSLMQNVAFVAAAGFAGYALQVRQDYVRAAEERAAEAERTRESEAQRRVEAERVRIAREVHDITAHSLSAVSIQAAAAERLIDVDPAAAKQAIAAVRATSKSALEDMRAMIGVLRSGEGACETAPTAGTERLSDLADYLRSAGVACELDVAGYARSIVPTHVDVALFGIAREACTNVVRHAQATRVSLTLSLSDPPQDAGASSVQGRVATLVVEDDGCGFDVGKGPVAGHGLEGMRERAHVLGGSFKAARGRAGGFRVSVSIPLETREGL